MSCEQLAYNETSLSKGIVELVGWQQFEIDGKYG